MGGVFSPLQAVGQPQARHNGVNQGQGQEDAEDLHESAHIVSREQELRGNEEAFYQRLNDPATSNGSCQPSANASNLEQKHELKVGTKFFGDFLDLKGSSDN